MKNLFLCFLIFAAGVESAIEDTGGPLPLHSLNHISILCKSLEVSLDFYQNVLGLTPIRRPASFPPGGAWLYGHGISIHLLQPKTPEAMPEKSEITYRSYHMSFQSRSMEAVERRVKEKGIKYMKNTAHDGDISVDQIFFHDPDGFTIEVCNCHKFPVQTLVGETVQMCGRLGLNNQQQTTHFFPSIDAKKEEEYPLCDA